MKFDIEHIAKLSCLELSREELEKYKQDIEKIAAMADTLPDVETGEYTDPDSIAELREDIVSGCGISREELLFNSPEVTGGCPVVPKTV
ncbi:MAG: Asp-tRNA(Asn)/Glu-tRNA(Gln) amidotransferase subunit GatC [Porcipelethomonas sp.]